MFSRIDMHIHTIASDGEDSISEIIELARAIPLEYIAITDHDTISGLQKYYEQSYCEYPIIINGIEMTCGYDPEIHILGHFIDIYNPHLLEILNEFQKSRVRRSLAFLRNLRKDYPVIKLHDIMRQYKSYSTDAITQYMIDIQLVQNESEAKERFFNAESKYYLAPIYIEPAKAIEAIKSSGGIASLAHLCRIDVTNETLRTLITELKQYGLEALEIYHSLYTADQINHYSELASYFHLLRIGGSDYHGSRRMNILGSPYNISSELVDKILLKIGRD